MQHEQFSNTCTQLTSHQMYGSLRKLFVHSIAVPSVLNVCYVTTIMNTSGNKRLLAQRLKHMSSFKYVLQIYTSYFLVLTTAVI